MPSASEKSPGVARRLMMVLIVSLCGAIMAFCVYKLLSKLGY